MGALVEYLIVRRVEGTSELNSLIVALGLFLVFDGLAFFIWGPLPRGFGPFSVFSGGPSCAGDVCIGRLSLGVLAVSGGLAYLSLEHPQRFKRIVEKATVTWDQVNVFG